MSIPTAAFSESGLRSISGYDKIHSLGDWAFYDTKLQSISLPDGLLGVSDIGDYCFGRTNLRQFKIPDAVTEIKSGVFKNCPLSYVYMHGGVTVIDGYAFDSDVHLKIQYVGTMQEWRAMEKNTEWGGWWYTDWDITVQCADGDIDYGVDRE